MCVADAAPLPAHDGTVVGVASDSTNKLLVTAGSDGALRVWDFRKQKLRAELPLGSGERTWDCVSGGIM